MTSYALVVASFCWVTFLEWAEKRLLLGLFLLHRKIDIATIGHNIGEESASLLNRIIPWLVAMQDQSISLGILNPAEIFLSLVRINSVADLIQISEWLGFDTCTKSWSGLGLRALRRTLLEVGKL